RRDGAKKLRPVQVYAVAAAPAVVVDVVVAVAPHHCVIHWLLFSRSGRCRQKMPRVAARMFAWGLLLAARPDNGRGGRPFGGNRLANAASVSPMNEISCKSSMFTELLVKRSASMDARP